MNEIAIDSRKRKSAIWLWLLVASGLIALLAANAHLLYVASTSQPACVGHFRQGDPGEGAGLYRAAKSSCSPTIGAASEGVKR
ncbi:hypothetical protein H8A99_03900 [Bradyrhizobium sp. Arg68]|uniref:hypothetical protein n=1 Tax=Bradyrhizobium ivorense TaxID=2511166 RepID=UPI001E541429|nr:hypothetical protein [Bradyrhizobium ivorense]MCC8935660.1 hypothetical protein [Bradyrhizobium ivorense]